MNNKIGLHLIMLYVLVGVHRFLWSLAVWRGQGTDSPARLTLRLLSSLPMWWCERFTVRALADSGFDADKFIGGLHDLGWHEVIGSRVNRGIGGGCCFADSRGLRDYSRR
jgi:hypothetical protein